MNSYRIHAGLKRALPPEAPVYRRTDFQVRPIADFPTRQPLPIHSPPTWKSATRQVGKPALQGGGPTLDAYRKPPRNPWRGRQKTRTPAMAGDSPGASPVSRSNRSPRRWPNGGTRESRAGVESHSSWASQDKLRLSSCAEESSRQKAGSRDRRSRPNNPRNRLPGSRETRTKSP